MDVMLNVPASHVVSSHIGHLCHDAADMTFARSSDVRLLAQSTCIFRSVVIAVLWLVVDCEPSVSLVICVYGRLRCTRVHVCGEHFLCGIFFVHWPHYLWSAKLPPLVTKPSPTRWELVGQLSCDCAGKLIEQMPLAFTVIL